MVTAAALRALLATQIATSWIFVEELVHADLARSLENGQGFLVRGQHVTVSFVYPLLIAPASTTPPDRPSSSSARWRSGQAAEHESRPRLDECG